MTPAENAFIQRQVEHLFQTDDCTLCGRAPEQEEASSESLVSDEAFSGFLDRRPA
jgi:hypothetical protein